MTAHEPRTLCAALAQWASRAPKGPACFDRTARGWIPIAWKELQRQAACAARAFRARGVRAGNHIAIQARGGSHWLAAEWAAYRCGAVVVGLDPFASADQLEQVLAETKPALALAETSAQAAALSRHGPAVALGAWRTLVDQGASGSDFDDSIAEAPATRIYTSGTTGEPKGLVFTHAQMLLAVRSIVEAYGAFSARDAVLCWLPMAHLFQREVNYVALACGAKLYCADDPRQVLACAQETEPTVFVGVPRFFEKLHAGIAERLAAARGWRKRALEAALAAGRTRGEALRAGRAMTLGERLRVAYWDRLVLRRIRAVLGRRLRFAVCGSAPIPVWLLKFFHDLGLPVLEACGVSENALAIAANTPTAWRFGSVGKPLRGNEVGIAEDGELLVRSAGLCEHYASGDPLSFTRKGFYRTGDLARLDGDGFLYLTGRKRDLIKLASGRRVALARVEAAYGRCPLVEQIAVFGHGRAYLAALIVLKRTALGADASHQVLSARLQDALHACEQDLAPHERIRAFAIEAEPFGAGRGELTATLKLRRDAIAANRRATLEHLYEAAPAPPVPDPAALALAESSA